MKINIFLKISCCRIFQIMERQQVYNSLEHRIVDFGGVELILVSLTKSRHSDSFMKLALKLTYEYLTTFFGGFYM